MKKAFYQAIFLFILSIILVLLISSGFLNTSSVSASIEIESTDNRNEVAEKVLGALNWDEEKRDEFFTTYRSIQWDAFKEALLDILSEEYGWSEDEEEIFLTQATKFLNKDDDILSDIHYTGVYNIDSTMSPAQISGVLIYGEDGDRTNHREIVLEKLLADDRRLADEFVKREQELLPDILPLTPQDISLRSINNRLYIIFATTYYNIGRGDLEIIRDPEKEDIHEDVETDILQKIYREDGSFRYHTVGNFFWHAEHLHYHFSDFAKYTLMPLDESGDVVEGSEAVQKKSTYCIRDVTKVPFADFVADVEAKYEVCGRLIQGISVGWGDTYFQTFADQNFDVTDLSSGDYRLSFIINPENRFEEISKDNNISYADVRIDKEDETVEILRRFPEMDPEFEHINIKETFTF